MTSRFRVRFHLDHRFAAANLSAYLDDELDGRARRRVERHLEGCAACRQELATLRQMVMLLQRAPLRRVPRSFALPRSVALEQARYARWSKVYGALRTGTAVVSLMLVTLLVTDVLFSTGTIALPDVMTPQTARTVRIEQPVAAPLAAPQAEAAPEPEAAPQLEATPVAEPAEPAASSGDLLVKSAPLEPGGVPDRIPGVAVNAEGPSGGGGERPETAGIPTSEGMAALSAAPEAEYGVTRAATQEDEPAVAEAQAAPSADTATTPLAEVQEPEPSPTVPAVVAVSQATPEPVETSEPMSVTQEALAPEWRVWQGVRLAAAVLLGLLLILAAGTLWSAHRRQA